MLGVVEKEAGRFHGQALTATGVASKELAEIEIPNLSAMPPEPSPGGGLLQRLSHELSPRVRP